jgi:large subunit ribosomal protein L6
MSRIGKKPIPVPKEVEVTFEGDVLSAKGPKGQLSRFIHPDIDLTIDDSQIVVSIANNAKGSKALSGLFRSLINNMIVGVSEGFKKTLEIVGVGYRVELSGNQLVCNVGYSNPVFYEIPNGIEVQVDKKNTVILNGIDKELVGVTAAKIRSFRPPEPYKGKGVKYIDEMVRRKAGKTGAKA